MERSHRDGPLQWSRRHVRRHLAALSLLRARFPAREHCQWPCRQRLSTTPSDHSTHHLTPHHNLRRDIHTPPYQHAGNIKFPVSAERYLTRRLHELSWQFSLRVRNVCRLNNNTITAQSTHSLVAGRFHLRRSSRPLDQRLYRPTGERK